MLALSTARLHHRLTQDKEVNPSATAPPSPAPVDNGLAEHLMEGPEYDRVGGPEMVHLITFALPDPQPDEVVVRVQSASIHPINWKIRSGDTRTMTGSRFPRAMGTDFAGNVEAVGSKLTRLKPGDAVVGSVALKVSGAFAPRLITTQDLVVRKPDGLSFAQAATLPIAHVTAWQALVLAGALTLAACGAEDTPPGAGPGGGGMAAPPPVRVATVAPQVVALQSELPGRVESQRVAQVRSRVNGVVLRRRFTEGSEAKAGRPLFLAAVLGGLSKSQVLTQC